MAEKDKIHRSISTERYAAIRSHRIIANKAKRAARVKREQAARMARREARLYAGKPYRGHARDVLRRTWEGVYNALSLIVKPATLSEFTRTQRPAARV